MPKKSLKEKARAKALDKPKEFKPVKLNMLQSGQAGVSNMVARIRAKRGL